MVELSQHSFPHTVRHLNEEVTLYAERDRRRITWRYHIPGGGRSPKRSIPRSLGPDGDVPDSGRVPVLAIEFAKKLCEQHSDERRGIARALAAAEQRKNHIRLGTVFDRIRESGWYRKLSASRLDEVDRSMRWVEAVLGRNFELSHWDADTIDLLYTARTERGITVTGRGRGAPDQRGKRTTSTFLAPVGRNTATKELRCIDTVFRKAMKIKLRPGDSTWLLDTHPNARVDLPTYGTRRGREIADHRVYEILLEYADAVDARGRFRFFLVLSRWAGRRLSTIRRFTRSVVLHTEDEIRAALDEQLCDYVRRQDRDRVARLYADAGGGALYIRYWMVKAGQSGDEHRVEQYDAVVPVPPVVMKEAERYFSRHWNRLGLEPDAPLFPGDDLSRSISAETVNSWWHSAELLAANDGRPLGMSPNNAWHGFRQNRRTELRGVHDKYARWLIGHSVLSGTPGITVSEGRYLGLVPADLVAAVRVEPDGTGED